MYRLAEQEKRTVVEGRPRMLSSKSTVNRTGTWCQPGKHVLNCGTDRNLVIRYNYKDFCSNYFWKKKIRREISKRNICGVR